MIRQVISGADVVVYLNNQVYARVAEISFQNMEPAREVQTIDTLLPAEEVPGPVRCRVTMRVYRLRRDGGAQGAGATTTWPDITRQKYAAVLVVDRVTDAVLFRADRCKMVSEDWPIGRALLVGTLTFQILSWSNEVQPAAG